MAISIADAKPGLTVYYLTTGMSHPEYGIITSVGWYVFVRFGLDQHSKACNPANLYWPPYYCAHRTLDLPGQKYDWD